MKQNIRVDGVHMHLENKKVSLIFFWIIWLMYTVVYMTKNCYSAAMASIVNEGVLTKSQTGLLTALFYLVYGPLQILGGIFADKYNPERLIKIGLVGAGIANTIIFFNQNYYVMLVTWTFNAIVQFALYPATFKIVSSQLAPGYRMKGVYFLSLSGTSGIVLAYLMAAVVSKWQHNFALSAIFLFVFAVVFHFACNWAEEYMVSDSSPRKEQNQSISKQMMPEISAWRLFSLSGFFLLIIVAALRYIVSNGVNTLSATMLMESYVHVSPSVGNLLNILILVSGVVGITLVNQFVYPRITRNEVTATILLTTVALPLMVLVCFVGKVPLLVMMVCLCVSSALLTGTGLLMSHVFAAFAKYGKNGLACGVYNSLASIAIVVQSYGVLLVADHAGWKGACCLFVILLIVAIVGALIALPMWNRFKQGRIK